MKDELSSGRNYRYIISRAFENGTKIAAIKNQGLATLTPRSIDVLTTHAISQDMNYLRQLIRATQDLKHVDKKDLFWPDLNYLAGLGFASATCNTLIDNRTHFQSAVVGTGLVVSRFLPDTLKTLGVAASLTLGSLVALLTSQGNALMYRESAIYGALGLGLFAREAYSWRKRSKQAELVKTTKEPTLDDLTRVRTGLLYLRNVSRAKRVDVAEDDAFWDNPPQYVSELYRQETHLCKQQDLEGQLQPKIEEHVDVDLSSGVVAEQLADSSDEHDLEKAIESITQYDMKEEERKPKKKQKEDILTSPHPAPKQTSKKAHQPKRGIVGLLIKSDIEPEYATRLDNTRRTKDLRYMLSSISEILSYAKKEFIAKHPCVFEEGRDYITQLRATVKRIEDRFGADALNPKKSTNGQFSIEDHLEDLSSIGGLVKIERKYGLNQEQDTYAALERVEREVAQEGYDPEVLHALLTYGLNLLSSSPRISEHYLPLDLYWRNVRRALGPDKEKIKVAKDVFRDLVRDGILSFKKGEVIRLDARWKKQEASYILRKYIGTVLDTQAHLCVNGH